MLESHPEGVMIVTGGSRGIGAATARLAAERGYAVCVNFVANERAALTVVDEIRDRGGRAIAVRADVAREADIVHLFDEAVKQFGPLTALVNNAGILERQGRVEDMDVARLERVFTTNITGAFLCAREAVRHMSTRHGGAGGVIVNVSSMAAVLGSPAEYVDYAASKGAIDTLTIGLGKEVAAEGVRVVGVRPGAIRTDIHASGGEPDRVDRVARSVPMQRGGEPEEVAATILWLASDAAAYITATSVDCSGGR